jgi:hypothetical protein
MAVVGYKIMGSSDYDSAVTYNTTMAYLANWYFIGSVLIINTTSTFFGKDLRIFQRDSADSFWSQRYAITGTAANTLKIYRHTYGGRPMWLFQNHNNVESPTINIQVIGHGREGRKVYYCAASPPSHTSKPNDYYKSNSGLSITAGRGRNLCDE